MNVDTQKKQELFRRTLVGLEESIRQYMPECAYREFCLWALGAEEPVREGFLKLLGVPQLVQLTVSLLGGTVAEQDWGRLIGATVPMSVYLTYEVISDNLAIGLAAPAPPTEEVAVRRKVLLAFNEAMVQRIQGNPLPAYALLAPVRSIAEQVSSFEQSLSPGKHRSLAKQFLAQHGHVSMHGLEHSLWPGLLANIESCAALARSLGGSQIALGVREGLANRYRGVTRLLESPFMPLSRRLEIGVDTILVEPVLGYSAGLLGDIHQPEAFPEVIADGSLAEALYTAAFLVRLLNDVGTTLLSQSEGERELLIETLRKEARGAPSFSRLLLDSAERFGPMMTRLQKDLEHGEFNLCIPSAVNLPAAQCLPLFVDRLTQVSALYARGKLRLRELLDGLSERLDQGAISQVIGRFVSFHERLYTHHYSDSRGEYAV